MTGQTAAEHDDEVTVPKDRRLLYQICRWTVAVILLQYGFAKLFGAQFTVLDSELDKPMGTVSGFWLTWYYFGYSPLFGNLLGLVQVGLGLALAFRRTTLLGAAGAAPLLAGITVLDVSYVIPYDAMLIALIGACCAGYLLWRHRRELAAVFWSDRNRAASRSRPRWAHAVLVVLLLAVPASCSYYVANYNNRSPTPLDGVWNVTAGTFQPSGLPGPAERVYFEHNRAHQVVLRSGQTWQTHHFEVDPATATIRIWRTWLSKGEQLLSGRYDLTGGRLVVTATDLASGQPLLWELRPVPPDQIRRGP
ncbi:hypothetical protein [Streptosporangium sp. 'caverna']|uniref:hypothetical protein n=1 Tax=Streptosporangium sp. 'caverna' TaxID=2202249 RepID=UPI000D7E3B4D|nr:hypothetical protein [Streptosporangium sp. 'caverna']AWS42747.1 hypothetical protein DKM19_16625 [Streptosporangium sp. 'caverna']